MNAVWQVHLRLREIATVNSGITLAEEVAVFYKKISGCAVAGSWGLTGKSVEWGVRKEEWRSPEREMVCEGEAASCGQRSSTGGAGGTRNGASIPRASRLVAFLL